MATDTLDRMDNDLARDTREAAPYPVDDNADPTKFAAYSRALLEEQRAAMEPLFLTWTQNLLFLAGLQWWSYDHLTGQFMPPRLPDWKEQPVRNLLIPYFKHTLAKVTKNRPATTCVPASGDPDDLQGAKLGDDVLRAKWQELRRSRTVKRAIAWVIPCGNAFIGPYWNQDSGLLHPLTTLVNGQKHDEETGEAVLDQFGQPVIETMECPCDDQGDPKMHPEHGGYDLEAEPAYIDIGEVGDKVYSPFQVFTDAGATSDEDSTFYLIVEPLLMREIFRRYPDAPNLVAEDTSEIERFDHLITGLTSGADTHLTASQTARDLEVPKGLVVHYFQRPSVKYPVGRHWVTCGTEILEAPGPLPDAIWPPLVHLKDIEVPGRFHGEATMTAAVGLNREYNEVNAQIKEHHNLLLRGKWLVPIGSNIRRGQITTQPGEVIQHTPGMAPVMADLKALPQKVYDEREQILSDFQLITGIHSISMGTPPPGVTSGKAFLTLQEADDSDLGPFIEMLESAIAEWGWLTLQIIQRYYEDERLLRVSGENNSYRVRAFKGADLSTIVDVVPQSGSAFPWSAVAKQSMMIELATELPGLFQDPETGQFDHERFRRMLPIGGTDALDLGNDLDISEASREEEFFEQWTPPMPDPSLPPEQQPQAPPFPVPLPWQDHRVHLRQHARLLKSASFTHWAPEAQAAFVQHWSATQAEIQAQQQQAMMQQAQAAALGGGQPAGPPPPQ